NNLDTVANAEANGTVVLGYTADIASANVMGLNPATGYFFNVIVKDAAGNKAVYATKNETTLADTTAPVAGNAGAITTASVATMSLTLNWTKATDDVSLQSALQYEVRRSAANNLDTVANVEANGMVVLGYTADIATANVTGLNPATGYFFNMIVKDAAGNKAVYATKNETTLADTTAPVAGNAGALTTANVATMSLMLNWTKATDDVSAQSALQYEVRRSAANNLDTVANAEANGTVVLGYTADIATANVTGLNAATGYYFNVIVKDAAGNKAVYITKNETTLADTTAPVAGNAGAITTASVSTMSLTLNWTKATDDVSVASALQYEVRRSSTNNIGTVANAEANGTIVLAYTADIATANVTGLSPATGYYFNVIVKDAAGNKAVYATKNETTPADTTAPTVGNAGAITTANVATTSLTLNWTKATDDVTVQANLQYEVRRSSTNNIDTVANAE